MVSKRDVKHIAEVASTLAQDDTVLEFGPWLGALSVEIAAYANLHVVDNFKWTNDHAKRVPDLMKPGDSFRPTLEQTLSKQALSVTIHECAFSEFRWSGGDIALIVIDGPKKAVDLADCLRTTVGCLKHDACILIKNALHPAYWELAALLEPLVAADCLRLSAKPIEAASNILELVPGSYIERAASLLAEADIKAPVGADFFERVNLAPAHPYRIAPLLEYMKRNEVNSAYEFLSNMKPERHLCKAWQKYAPDTKADRTADTFNDVFAVHHTAIARKLPEPIGSSSERLLRSAWLNLADRSDRANRFQPDLMEQARLYGYMGWPNKVRSLVYGKRVLDVGCGPGLHGLGYIASGAESYLGVDPIIKTNRDWVKNLAAGKKMEFGWTPEEISARLNAWDVQSIGIEDLADDLDFDLVVLHNVTEHLPNIEAAFATIASVMCSGGHILYNHDNFYSWNGHHLPPKKVKDFDPSDPAQLELVDWRHLDFVPPPEHYISRGLNRIRLDELIALTKRYFTIEQMDEVPSSPAIGGERLTDEVLARHPDYTRRELSTKNLFCVARRA
jgi:SAM-dependent methyltransferase